MPEDQLTSDLDLRALEAEFCRLPDVMAARVVADDAGRPVEVHVLAGTGKHAKQVVRDIQSVALASFGIDVDRRIVSVVQLGEDGAGDELPDRSTGVQRMRIISIDTSSTGIRGSVKVTLGSNSSEATGFAEGPMAAATRPRLVAFATLDALRQLEPAAEQLDVASAELTHSATGDVVLITLVVVDPPHEWLLTGSAIVHNVSDDAVVRGVLDAVNRRLRRVRSDRPTT